MPQNQPYEYEVVIDGVTYDVSSPTPLTDVQAYQYALTQSKATGVIGPAPSGMQEALTGAGQVVEGLKEPFRALGAVPGVVGHLMDPETRGATLRGFTSGATEGAQSLLRMFTDPKAVLEGVTGASLPTGDEPVMRAVGRTAATLPLLLAGPGARAMKRGVAGAGARAAARQEAVRAAKGAGRLIPERAPDLNAVLTEALESTRTPEPPTQVSMPVPQAGLPATASAAESRARQAAQRGHQGPRPQGPPPTTPTGPAPAAPAQAPTPSVSSRRIAQPERVGPTVGEMRGAYGAERTADYLNQMPGLREELGVPITLDMVQDIAGGPSRTPTAVSNRFLDDNFARLIAEDRGSVTIGGAGELLDAVRREFMLSGAATPKSLAGNVGAPVAAALEGASPFGAMGILDEALRLPTNLREFGRAWRDPRAAIQGPGAVGMAGPIARTMGAGDAVAQSILRRAGVPEERILDLTLQHPSGGRWADNLFGSENTLLRRTALPFTRTAGNVVRTGADELRHLVENPLSRRSAVTAGAMGAGVAESSADADPMTQIFTMALLGPRALPFGLASATTDIAQGKRPQGRLLSALTPVPEMTFDPGAWTGFPPSFMRYWK